MPSKWHLQAWRCRSSGDDLASRRVLTELLICMTNATNKPGCLVYIMACTNRMMDCDPALLRRWVEKFKVACQLDAWGFGLL